MNKSREKLVSKKSLYSSKLVFGFIFLGAISCYIYLRLPKAMPVAINEIAPTASARVTLSLPASINTKLSQEASADITIDTETAQVTAVQVELSYDASAISTPTIVQGDFLTSKLGNPKIQNGIISFTYVIPVDATGKSGRGKLATLKFKPLKGNSQLSFGRNTMVAVVGTNANELKSATGSNIIISATSEKETANPPVLADIKPAPVQNTTPSQPQNSQPKINVTTTQERVFNESGNFDYSNSINNIESDLAFSVTQDAPLSGFSLFIAKIKAFLGMN